MMNRGGRHPSIYDDAIYGFFDEYRFLSNFYECLVILDGLTFGSSEAAYMSRKTDVLADKVAMTTMTPSQAKKFGREIKIKDIKAWDSERVLSMHDAVWSNLMAVNFIFMRNSSKT